MVSNYNYLTKFIDIKDGAPTLPQKGISYIVFEGIISLLKKMSFVNLHFGIKNIFSFRGQNIIGWKSCKIQFWFTFSIFNASNF